MKQLVVSPFGSASIFLDLYKETIPENHDINVNNIAILMILGGNLLGLLPSCPLFCFAQLQSRSLCSSKVGIESADIYNTISFFSLQLVAVGGGCPYILFDKFIEI